MTKRKEKKSQLKNTLFQSLSSTPINLPDPVTNLTNPTNADEDPFPLSNIIGGVVVCAAAGVILVVVIVTLCLRRHRKPSLQPTPSVPAKADSLDRKLGWSERIMDVELFRALALDTSHDKTAYSANFENTFDSRYSRTWDGTLLKTFHSGGGITLNGTVDETLDDTGRCFRARLFALDSESDLSSRNTLSDLDDQSVSSFRTWLLGSMDLLHAIPEEHEEARTHDNHSGTDSSRSNDNAGGDADVDSNRTSGDADSLPLFQFCSEGAAPRVLDTAFSESTTATYETCGQSRATSFHTCSEHPHPRFQLDEGQNPGEGRVKDDCGCSGTSDEVSSGCFDLSYVTFHTLSDSACEDSSLQAVYDCFDPSVRVESDKSQEVPPKPPRRSRPPSNASYMSHFVDSFP